MTPRVRRGAAADPTSLLVVVVLLACGFEAGAAQEHAVESLGWMSGCWMDREASSEEVWTTPSAGLLLGLSRSESPAGGVAFEYMRIQSGEGGVTLFASPGGAPATAFPAVVVASDRFRVERPDHDFPRAIEYRPAGPDSLIALVYGEVDGAEPAFALRFGRTPCPGEGS